MWSAIKSDLFDFVDTIKNDTSKTLSKVIGETNDDDNDLEISIRQKALTDLRRSFNTYASPIEQQNIKEYEKYLKTFSLSSQAAEISTILDEEQDVARFYTELVPVQIRPEEFWARYFYRNLLLTRNGVVNLDDDDDDDEGWESTEKTNDNTDNNSNNNTNNNNNKNTTTIEGRTINDIYDENINLKKHITSLTLHIAELEKLLEAERSNVKRLMESTTTLPPRSISPSSQSVPITTTTVIEATEANDIISPIEKVPTILSLAETFSDKSESSSGVLVDMTETAPKVLTPENKAKILASLDNDDDDDDDDEWS